jgi:D-alanine-D-alanine ligase
MKIVVLCGGLSTERNISFLSGTKVCRALRKRGHQAVLVDLFMGLEDIKGEPAELFEKLPPLKDLTFDGSAPDLKAVRRARKWKSPSLFGKGVLEICRAADIVFVALHGMNGEDGRVQATFDMLGIPYTGSGYLGAAIAMDKMLTKEMVKDKGVRTPAWKTFNAGALTGEDDIVKSAEEIAAKIEAPCVIKTPTGGSSVGVYIVTNQDAVRPAVEKCLGFGPDILVEQMIEGREFTCAVLQDRALPSVEIVPKVDFYNYENKYKAGATEEICPWRCTPEVEKQMGDMALKVHNTLGLRTYSRRDFIVDKYDNAWFLEVNTLPGMTPTSLVPQEAAAVGISYEDLCEIIVNDGLDR